MLHQGLHTTEAHPSTTRPGAGPWERKGRPGSHTGAPMIHTEPHPDSSPSTMAESQIPSQNRAGPDMIRTFQVGRCSCFSLVTLVPCPPFQQATLTLPGVHRPPVSLPQLCFLKTCRWRKEKGRQNSLACSCRLSQAEATAPSSQSSCE